MTSPENPSGCADLASYADLESAAMRAIGPGNVTYLPGSFDKRFGRNMAALAEAEEYALSERQRWLLWRMVWRYRRQIGSQLLIAEALRRADDPEPAPKRAQDQAPRPPRPLPGRTNRSACTRSGRLRR
jgi:hypothetical protein